MKKSYCDAYKTNFITNILDRDPNIYGLIFSKSKTTNKMEIWELSPMIFDQAVKPVDVTDDDVKWAYVDETNPSTFEYPNGGKLPNDDYNLQFHDTIPDFVLFNRENLMAILRKSDDDYLYISGAKIDYGLGRNDFRDTSENTVYPTLKAETKFTYRENDMDEVYWNVDIGLPCPTLWDGAIAKVINKIKGNGTRDVNESFTMNKLTIKDAIKIVIDKIREI